MSEKLTCTESSSSANEHLYGTAPRVENWFLLEYPEHWEKDALDKSHIPEEVKTELGNLLKTFKNSRLQLIKKDDNKTDTINFYYIKSTETDPRTYHFQLNDYKEILELNLADLVDKGDISDSESDEKIVLVCTHGAYDSCCGKFGIPVFSEISKIEGINAWRSTHVGAHRFSANVVMLPEGVYYGRIAPDSASFIVETHLKGHIATEHLRGRCCYGMAAQVSEFFLRDKSGITGIGEIKLEFVRDRDEYTTVEFLVESENLVYTVGTMVLNNAITVKASCTDDEMTKIPQFYFYSMITNPPE